MFRTAYPQHLNERSRVRHQPRTTPTVAPAFMAGASPCIRCSFSLLLRADRLEECQSVGGATAIELCTALNSEKRMKYQRD